MRPPAARASSARRSMLLQDFASPVRVRDDQTRCVSVVALGLRNEGSLGVGRKTGRGIARPSRHRAPRRAHQASDRPVCILHFHVPATKRARLVRALALRRSERYLSAVTLLHRRKPPCGAQCPTECLSGAFIEEPPSRSQDSKIAVRNHANASAIFCIPHVLFQQRPTSSICYRKIAEIIFFCEAERSELASNTHRNRRLPPLCVGRCPDLAQPIKILRSQVRIDGYCLHPE